MTSGHIDVIERAARVFGEVIVAVAPNPGKEAVFTVAERLDMLREVLKHIPNVRIDAFEGLLVEYAKSQGASVIVKGLRAVSDFEFEFQMALMNRNLAPEVETVFVMTGAQYSYLSSSIVKEIAQMGGPIEGLVPESVARRLAERIKESIS